MVADDEIGLLARVSTPSKAAHKTWSLQGAEHDEGGSGGDGDEDLEVSHVKFVPPEGSVPSPQLQSFEDESSSKEAAQSDSTQPQLNLSLDTSQMYVRSTDTTLEYFDAPLSEEREGEDDGVTTARDDEVVTINITVQAEKDEPEKTPAEPEEAPLITAEDEEREEEKEAKEEEKSSEEPCETGLEQETTNEEDESPFLPEMVDEEDLDLSSKLDAALADQDTSTNTEGNSLPLVILQVCFTPVLRLTTAT